MLFILFTQQHVISVSTSVFTNYPPLSVMCCARAHTHTQTHTQIEMYAMMSVIPEFEWNLLYNAEFWNFSTLMN